MRRTWWLFDKQIGSYALVALWGILVAAGIMYWADYERTPGMAASAQAQWPLSPTLQRDARRPTLVVVLHPKCPCSEATLSELSALMDRWLHDVRAYVVFMHLDEGQGVDDESSLRKAASRIAGVEVIDDRDAGILRHLGAFTSGQTYLYDAQGRLVFQGGITPVRGQTGTNRGSLAIASYLESNAVRDRQTPVYGCLLDSVVVK